MKKKVMNTEGDNGWLLNPCWKNRSSISSHVSSRSITCHWTEQDFRNSAFYRLLINPDTNLWRDDAEENFRRLQNEIEYGAWNRNERGEIAE